MDTKYIQSELETAIALLKNGEPERAVWRIADAAGKLREKMEAQKVTNLVGLTEPTGMGFSLPSRAA